MKANIVVSGDFPDLSRITEPTLIVAPRRSGKTRYIRELCELLAKEDRKPGIIGINRTHAEMIRDDLRPYLPMDKF